MDELHKKMLENEANFNSTVLTSSNNSENDIIKDIKIIKHGEFNGKQRYTLKFTANNMARTMFRIYDRLLFQIVPLMFYYYLNKFNAIVYAVMNTHNVCANEPSFT